MADDLMVEQTQREARERRLALLQRSRDLEQENYYRGWEPEE